MPSTVPEMQVAAGVLSDADGRVLVGQRTQPDRYRNQWEFPGGKLEPGEDIAEALARELAEELGVAVEGSEPLIYVHHRYPDRDVHLHVLRVTRYRGRPRGREGQALRWVAPGELSTLPMLAANQAVVRALNLPPCYAITDLRRFDLETILSRLPALVAREPLLLQIREKHLSTGAYGALIRDLVPACKRLGIRVLGNLDPGQARELGLDGVHLSSDRLAALRQRPMPAQYWVGASCHNRAELDQAARIGADFVVLSPVRTTPGYGERAPLGWEGFADLCRQARLPVYALGGVGLEDITQARRSGGQGVAMIRGAWEISPTP